MYTSIGLALKPNFISFLYSKMSYLFSSFKKDIKSALHILYCFRISSDKLQSNLSRFSHNISDKLTSLQVGDDDDDDDDDDYDAESTVNFFGKSPFLVVVYHYSISNVMVTGDTEALL